MNTGLHATDIRGEGHSQGPMSSEKRPDISVVCPFYNEGLILERAIEYLVDNISRDFESFEIILVNDGSTDDSRLLAARAIEKFPNVRLLSYQRNMGRGFALRSGIEAARGDIIVTTEIDLSWGDSIAREIFDAFAQQPSADVVVASPHRKPGGYKNVPPHRVFISSWGNILLRLFCSRKISMFTGMTRGYRREIIQTVRLNENRKEFHLEAIFKLMQLGCKIIEVPAVLEWKEGKLIKPENKEKKRKSSSKIPQLVVSHLSFAIFAQPIRYYWFLGLCSLFLSAVAIIAGVVRLLSGEVSIYLLLTSLGLCSVALLFFGFGILATQNNRILRELSLKGDLKPVTIEEL